MLGYHEETFTSRAALTNNDFGNWTIISKSGVKFEDLDADGAAREAGEPGLPGWTIYVDYDNDGVLDANEPSAVTGAMALTRSPGSTRARGGSRKSAQAGWTNSFPALGYYEETFLSGSVLTGNDFGNWRYATKSGTKFEDKSATANYDGVWDPDGADNIANTADDEGGLENWVIRAYADNDSSGNLSAGDTPYASDSTDANGLYELSLEPGKYIIVEVLQPLWTQSGPSTSVNTFNPDLGEFGYVITLTSGQLEDDNNFGNYQGEPLEGFSPGFWKNHTGAPYAPGRQANAWNPAYLPGPISAGGTALSSVFNTAGTVGTNLDGNGTADSMLDALNFKGGSGVAGGARTLLRQAVAGVLNATQGSINYPLTLVEVVSMCNTALASNDKGTMLALASQLDGYNNLHGTIDSLQATKTKELGSLQKSKSVVKAQKLGSSGGFTAQAYAFESIGLEAIPLIVEPATTSSLLTVSAVTQQSDLTFFSATPTLSGSTTSNSAPLAVDVAFSSFTKDLELTATTIPLANDVAFSSLDTSNQLLLATSGGSDSDDEADSSAAYASGEWDTYEDADLVGASEDEVFALLGSAL